MANTSMRYSYCKSIRIVYQMVIQRILYTVRDHKQSVTMCSGIIAGINGVTLRVNRSCYISIALVHRQTACMKSFPTFMRCIRGVYSLLLGVFGISGESFTLQPCHHRTLHTSHGWMACLAWSPTLQHRLNKQSPLSLKNKYEALCFCLSVFLAKQSESRIKKNRLNNFSLLIELLVGLCRITNKDQSNE